MYDRIIDQEKKEKNMIIDTIRNEVSTMYP